MDTCYWLLHQFYGKPNEIILGPFLSKETAWQYLFGSSDYLSSGEARVLPTEYLIAFIGASSDRVYTECVAFADQLDRDGDCKDIMWCSRQEFERIKTQFFGDLKDESN